MPPRKKEPLDFTKAQLQQIDSAENAAHQLACALCKDVDLDWNMEYIGEIADAAEAILHAQGHTTYYPAITEDTTGATMIVEGLANEEA